MTISTFFIIAMIVLFGLVVVPLTGLFLLHRKYGPSVPGKVAVVMWVVTISYFGLFFVYAGDLVPDRYKMEPKQVYQCGWKTIYVERNK